MPTGRLDGEGEHGASLELKPLPWPQCALLILLGSALCYGLGYLVVDLLVRGAL